MSLGAQLDQLKGKVLELFLPACCFSCGKEGSFLCSSCHHILPRLLPPVCTRCGRQLVLDEGCPYCRRWKLEIDSIQSPYMLQGPVRQAVHDFKYRGYRALAGTLARLMYEHLQRRPPAIDAIVPVPLHHSRLRQRGYNQSLLLARELSKLSSLPVLETSLTRTRNTPAQVGRASAEERRRNVSGAFACPDSTVRGQRLLLIDDVCTTGATLDACAVALKHAGAAAVWGLTLAREG